MKNTPTLVVEKIEYINKEGDRILAEIWEMTFYETKEGVYYYLTVDEDFSWCEFPREESSITSYLLYHFTKDSDTRLVGFVDLPEEETMKFVEKNVKRKILKVAMGHFTSEYEEAIGTLYQIGTGRNFKEDNLE